jgi:hypothetical protein
VGDGRVVSARVTNPVSVSTGNSYGYWYKSIVYDTHGAISFQTNGTDTRTIFTAPCSGYYSVSFTAGTSNGTFIYLFKVSGGVSTQTYMSYSTSANIPVSVSTTVQLNAGDYIYPGLGSGGYNLQPDCPFCVQQITSGNQAITNGETVACEVWTNTVTTGSPTANFIFNQVNADTHNAWNTTTGIYTAPMRGWYNLTIFINPNASTASTAIDLYKSNDGGVTFSKYKALQFTGSIANPSPAPYVVSTSGCILLNAGDRISVRSSASYVAYGTSTLAANSSWLTVNRIQ